MKNQNQTGLKNFKPKINLNHNIYIYFALWVGDTEHNPCILILQSIYLDEPVSKRSASVELEEVKNC